MPQAPAPERHHQAMLYPMESERPLVLLIEGWRAYADRFQRNFGMPIGKDAFLGKQWENIGDALRKLFNGETGRLERGTLDALVLNTMQEHGIDVSRK